MVKITCESFMNAKFLCETYNNYEEVIVCLDFCSDILSLWKKFTERFRSLPSSPKIHCVFSVGMHAIGFADLGDYSFEGLVSNLSKFKI